MLWVAVKVLFFRQVYGLRHRWLSSLLATAGAITLISLPQIYNKPPPDPNHPPNTPGFSQTALPDYSYATLKRSFNVVVFPDDPVERQLIVKAKRIMTLPSNNKMFPYNIVVTFTANVDRMLSNLAKAKSSSVGVHFNEITESKLEYTLRPVINSQDVADIDKISNKSGGALNNETLSNHVPNRNRNFVHELQFAIDMAYIQIHVSGFERLQFRRLPYDFQSEKSQEEDKNGVPYPTMYDTYRVLLAIGTMFIALVLATYTTIDKMSGVRELMCVNGVPRWMVNSSWLVSFCLLMIIVGLVQAVILAVPFSRPLVPNVSIPILAVFLIVYGWTVMVSANFAANLFSSQVLTLIAIFTYCIVSSVLVQLIPNKNFIAQGFIVALIPNIGLALFFFAILEFSLSHTKLTFNNIFTTSKHYLYPGTTLLLMVVNMVVYSALAFYLDLVRPGPYGRARPWYLFTWKGTRATIHPAVTPKTEDNPFLEKIGNNYIIALECVNLVKSFGLNRAVNDLNLKIIKNKVTVLLGHNGAGKSTLFSILCGMTKPTSGNFYTEDYDVFKGSNIKRFCTELGYCPQENLLLNELTVQQHMVIFGMLKGLSRSEAREFSDNWTNQFEMYSLRNTQVKKLSGGTKRKLSLAIAMTGTPKYALLDEPSSGMDTESARKMWNVLLAQKGRCTIIITTHNMDEADILGDRIAIMASGQLKCYGSTSFLKAKLDTGYRLNCSADNKNTQDVIHLVKKSIPSATVIYKMNRTVTFGLPSTTLNSIPDLLRGLESKFGESVASTLAFSTLDDVFVKVQKAEGVKIEVDDIPNILDDEINHRCLQIGHIEELFIKRVKWLLSTRVITMIFLLMLLPAAASFGSMYLLNSLLAPRQYNEIKPNSFSSHTFGLISSQHDNITDLIRSTLMKNGISYEENEGGLYAALVHATKKHLLDTKSQMLFVIDTKSLAIPMTHFSTPNSTFIGYSAFINSLLQGKSTILTHSSPFWKKHVDMQMENQDTRGVQPGICSYSPGNMGDTISTLFLGILGPFLLTANAYFIIFPHEERITLFKHLQLSTGLLPVVYWSVNFLFDLILFIFTIALIIIVVTIMDLSKGVSFFYLHYTTIGYFILVLLLYGMSCILYAYLWGFAFQSSTLVVLVFILINVFLFILLYNLRIPTELAYFMPWAIMWLSIRKLVVWGGALGNCHQCVKKTVSDCYENLVEQQKTTEPQDPPFPDMSLKTELISFGIITGVYFSMLVLLDHGFGRKVMRLVNRVLCGGIKQIEREVDPEVAEEKHRVNNLKNEDGAEQPQLICDSLGKKYSCKNTAVYDVTFIADRGECFGLVGVNGAGKTTTFGMLAALLTPTKGTAIIEGQWRVTGCEYKYMKKVGYCPQYDGLLKGLSARDTIKLFARLRGVSRTQTAFLVDKWVNALDMADIANRACGTYSGGNKRKLTVAITMIGNPPVVLLDEPTAAVDSIVRRKIYQILSDSLEKNKQTIILTSHAMSECEAICDRLTIMVKGVMKCLGPIAKLKKTFGKSCILLIKFKGNATEKERGRVQTKVESLFPGNVDVEEKTTTQITFIIKTEELKVYDVFASLLHMKSEFPAVEEFNLTETPLEQVFLKFAQKK